MNNLKTIVLQGSNSGSEKYEFQRESTSLFVEFDKICQKLGIKYFMLAGTMLGAVRHKGWIPWDYDIDLALYRDDFDKFIKGAPKVMQRNLLIRHSENDRIYQAALVNPAVIGRFQRGANLTEEPLELEIHPLDGVPSSKLARSFFLIRLRLLRSLFRLSQIETINSNVKRPMRERFVIQIFRILRMDRLLDSSRQWRNLDRHLRKNPIADSEHIIVGVSRYKSRDIHAKAVFGEGAKYEFDGHEFSGPLDYHSYLSKIYGDYQTPREDHDDFLSFSINGVNAITGGGE
jgi:lipopolysaccharide cholinephosphotransferase